MRLSKRPKTKEKNFVKEPCEQMKWEKQTEKPLLCMMKGILDQWAPWLAHNPTKDF